MNTRKWLFIIIDVHVARSFGPDVPYHHVWYICVHRSGNIRNQLWGSKVYISYVEHAAFFSSMFWTSD